MKETYDAYFKSYSGLFYLSDMIQSDVSSDLKKSRLVEDFNLQHNAEALYNLSSIVSGLVTFFNSPDFDSSIEEAYDGYLQTISLD